MEKKLYKQIDDFFLGLINFIRTILIFFPAILLFNLIQIICINVLIVFITVNLSFILIFYLILFKKVIIFNYYNIGLIIGAYIISLLTISDIKIDKKDLLHVEQNTSILKYQDLELNEQIKYLKSKGFTKEQTYEKLKNKYEFRELIKNKNEKFNKIYDKGA
jgi:hypothetical protein